MTMLIADWQWGYDGWIIVITSLVAMTCAIPGSLLLVRRQSMLGDAVSHAVLPGIAIGFLVSGTRDGGWMLGGGDGLMGVGVSGGRVGGEWGWGQNTLFGVACWYHYVVSIIQSQQDFLP